MNDDGLKESIKKTLKVGILVIAAAALLGFAYYFIWQLPCDMEKDIEIQNKIRATHATIIGGVLFLIAMYIAYKRAKAMEDNVEANRETLTLEQYTRAIDQLGNDNIAVRLGGIYSLEQIMNSKNEHDSKYHDQIIELLAAYVRDRRKYNEAAFERDKDFKYEDPARFKNILEKYSIAVETDVRAILTVLGRRENKENEKVEIDLKYTNWMSAELSSMKLEGFNLSYANFENANLGDAELNNAILEDVNFENADLFKAKLKKAMLWCANLNNAKLKGVNLKNALLTDVKLENAELWNSNLMEIITSFFIYDKESNKLGFNIETDESIIAFIQELEKAEFVLEIQLDEEYVEIIMNNKEECPKLYKEFQNRIEKEYPDLYKRINKK